MDQIFEGTPKAEIRLHGHKVVRSEVSHDWGLRLQWQVKRDGQVIATPPARADLEYEHPELVRGKYELVLQMWKYVNYKKKDGQFVDSKFVDISNTVSFTI